MSDQTQKDFYSNQNSLKILEIRGIMLGTGLKAHLKMNMKTKHFHLNTITPATFILANGITSLCLRMYWSRVAPDQAAELPHEQGYEIARFLERHIFKPLALELSAKLQFDLQPFSTLQVAPTFYRNRIALNMHRDKAFLQVIIGPASGLKIKPKNSNTTQLIDLELGEILVYTGFQFQEYFAEVPALDDIEPLLHGVVVNEDKRMSIIGGTLLKI